MNEEIKNELLKRINSNISTYGNTKPHLGHDGINQVMDFISTIRREAVIETEKKVYERLCKDGMEMRMFSDGKLHQFKVTEIVDSSVKEHQ